MRSVALLHNRDLLLRQPVQLPHQPIDLVVGGIDLPLEQLLSRGRLGISELSKGPQHSLSLGYGWSLRPFEEWPLP